MDLLRLVYGFLTTDKVVNNYNPTQSFWKTTYKKSRNSPRPSGCKGNITKILSPFNFESINEKYFLINNESL